MNKLEVAMWISIIVVMLIPIIGLHMQMEANRVYDDDCNLLTWADIPGEYVCLEFFDINGTVVVVDCKKSEGYNGKG